ncbi:aspartate beta-hydroxylase domain-containing protein 2-like [Mizuhopecten yessoensis]|uniref:Aspartate beta-hydroxylase domain-containing protein 2 n=1 Tax=Mizuhopecten yessoensis TaxID=6573 RepID=A0A210Q0K5_MIZYE|nr:aspartate beta-hydroxylase domain-containing protein 2-like [Mizuhopecten yessoensis]OWF42266.1 Aspartate beta-hydroxylase domain-containing protein 2 [Mizuhopecten yessoensis]
MFHIMDHLGIIIALITFTVSVIYFLKYFNVFKMMTRPDSSIKFKKCESPGCVRCNLYDEVLTDAADRLEKLCQHSTDKQDLHQDLKRIKNSFKTNIPTRSEQKPEVFYLHGLTAMPWWTSSFHFATDVKILEDNFNVICQEFFQVNSDSRAFWKVNSTPNGQWKVLHLVNQGKVQRDMVDLCPKTFDIASSLQSLMTKNVFANVAFSVIEPGTVITEHYGPTNTRLRCHLGLVTPSSCHLCVAGSCCDWRRGECLLFDDSHLHSVVHEGDQWRAVFMVDLWHPHVTRPERSAIDIIFKSES